MSEQSYIWGSGVINESKEIPRFDPSKIKALRGKKTVKALMKKGYAVPDVPLGDPGYLIKNAYLDKSLAKKYRACIIPHHASIDDPIFRKYKSMDDVYVFNMLTDDPCALNEMLASEVVISQSLHGLIFAESFGIPSLWISNRFDNNWFFKFEDWYSTTANPQLRPLPLETPLEEMISQCRLSECFINVDELKNSLPSDEVVYQSAENKKDFGFYLRNSPRFIEADLFCESIFLNDFEKEDLLLLEKKLRGLHRKANEDFSIPSYTVIGSARVLENQDVIQRITEFLDKKHEFVNASIVFGAEPANGERVYQSDGLSFSKSSRLGEAFLIRGNGRVDLGGSLLTFYI